MPDYGLTDKGFKRKRYLDIRQELAEQWKGKFGNSSRTDEKSVNGILISLISFVSAQVWKLAENVYNSGFVHKADGESLSNLTMNNLIERQPSQRASGFIKITGDPGTIVEEGFRVASEYEFATVEEVEIGEEGTVLAPIESVIFGADANCGSGNINDIVTQIVGVQSVTNPEDITGGREEETDDELRTRYMQSLATGASPTVNGIRTEVLSVAGVRTATVVENLGSSEDSEGRPGHSFETYVFGGSEQDIAHAIFERRSAGVQAFGDITIEVEDDSGNSIPIGFSRAEEVEVYINIEIRTNSEFEENGRDNIRSAIIEYIGGQDKDGSYFNGLQTGQDVHLTKLISIIHQINGVESVLDIQLGSSESDLEVMKDIEVDRIQVANTSYDKIDIT